MHKSCFDFFFYSFERTTFKPKLSDKYDFPTTSTKVCKLVSNFICVVEPSKHLLLF